MSLALVDYGAGNLPSVERAFARLGVRTFRAREGRDLGGARGVVLPGVGHYAALARALKDRGLAVPLRSILERGVPFLGICLGMHALYGGSDEAPDLPGLGLLPGRVRALPPEAKRPHMGWNQVRPVRESPLFEGLPEGAWFYFAHSYAAEAAGEALSAICVHGAPFAAAVERGSARAVQFHPEKSGAPGAKVLSNFAGRVA